MFETMKKAVLASVGAALITTERAEAALKDLVAEGRLNAAEAKALARDIAARSQSEFKAVRGEVEQRLHLLATGVDEKAKARIAELEARIAELEAKQKRSGKSKARARSRTARG